MLDGVLSNPVLFLSNFSDLAMLTLSACMCACHCVALMGTPASGTSSLG